MDSPHASVGSALGSLNTFEYWRKEYCNFRDIMCSTKWTPEQKRISFGCLWTLLMQLNDEDHSKAEPTWRALEHEFIQRRIMEGA